MIFEKLQAWRESTCVRTDKSQRSICIPGWCVLSFAGGDSLSTWLFSLLASSLCHQPIARGRLRRAGMATRKSKTWPR